jgi:hypothetical protein
MALNFFRFHTPGGGPALVLKNPAPVSCICIGLINSLVAVGALSFIIYGNFINTSFNGEVTQYLLVATLQGGYAAIYFLRLAAIHYAADNEWSKILITVFFLNVTQYGLIHWGVWLIYQMYMSHYLIGTRMYYYFLMGKWVYNAILAISSLNALCIILTLYTALVRMLSDLVSQIRCKKHVK